VGRRGYIHDRRWIARPVLVCPAASAPSLTTACGDRSRGQSVPGQRQAQSSGTLVVCGTRWAAGCSCGGDCRSASRAVEDHRVRGWAARLLARHGGSARGRKSGWQIGEIFAGREREGDGVLQRFEINRLFPKAIHCYVIDTRLKDTQRKRGIIEVNTSRRNMRT
jgi:hypothetical protein